MRSCAAPPPQGDLLDDQHIVIRKIKLVNLQQELEFAQAEGVVPSLALPALAVGFSLGSLGHASSDKKGWFQ